MKEKQPLFTVTQLAHSAEFQPLQDALRAVLQPPEFYTKSQAELLLRQFLERRI